jgi:hypothetical protein
MPPRFFHAWHLAALLLLFLAPTALAQNQVRLRLAYQGRFLPEGTVIVVLGKPVDVPPDSVIQPRFFSEITYPRGVASIILRDTLAASGFSRQSIPKSSEARMRYFLYALTPDGTLYWSYSALRDALKYDVVEKGVMSIAPVSGVVATSDIKQLFFSDPPVAEASPADTAGEAPVTVETSAARIPSGTRGRTIGDPAPQTNPEERTSEATVEGSDGSGIRLPFWLFLLWLVAPAAAALALAHRYLQARQVIAGMREEMTTLRTELAARFFRSNPDTAKREAREQRQGTLPPAPGVGNPIDPKRWNP